MSKIQEPIETDISKEDFLKKIEKQYGYIDAVDSFRLVHFYTHEFGVLMTEMPIEYELCYMYQRLLGNKVLKKKFTIKPCNTCGIIKKHTEYKFRNNVNCDDCVKKTKSNIAK